MMAATMTKIAEASGLAFGGAPFGGAVTGGAGVGDLVLMKFSPMSARSWQALREILSFEGTVNWIDTARRAVEMACAI